jgi:hypothetical protein
VFQACSVSAEIDILGVRILFYREIFGPKREEVAGGWRRLHNEELHNLYTSPNTLL